MQWLLDVDEQYLRDLDRPPRPEGRRSRGRIAYRSALAALAAVVLGEVALLAVPGLKDQLLAILAVNRPALPRPPPASAGQSKLPAPAVVVVGPMSPLPASSPAALPLVTGVVPHQPAPRPPAPPAAPHAKAPPEVALAAPLPHPVEAAPAPARPQPAMAKPQTVPQPPAAHPLASAAPLPHPIEAAPSPAPPRPVIVRAAPAPQPPAAPPLANAAPLPHPIEAAPSPVPSHPAVVTAAPAPQAAILAAAAPLPHPIEAAPSPARSQPDMATPRILPQPTAAPKANPHAAAAASKPATFAAAGQAQAAPQARPAARTAAVAPPASAAKAPLDQHLRVELSFTADEAGAAAALTHRLRRQGFAVTSRVIPFTPGRWPGVAFFFDSDRVQARAIAEQLGAVTGRHEHARLSPRHPYPKPGTVEVSLLSDRTTEARSSGTPGDPHRRP